MSAVKNYIDQNKDRFIEELISLLKIPSVSADKAYEKDVLMTAETVKNYLDGKDQAQVESFHNHMMTFTEIVLIIVVSNVVLLIKFNGLL